MSRRGSFLIIMSLAILISCQRSQIKENITFSPQEHLTQALEKLQAKKYNDAIKMFEEIIFNYPTTQWAVEAQYYLAEAYFQKKDYRSAITEYEFFINNFSTSQYLEDAYYKLAVCYLKTAPSIKRDLRAIQKSWEILETLQENFPNTKYADEIQQLKNEILGRWAKKYYDIGLLYYRGGEPEASRVYFNYVIQEYPNTQWANWSKFMIAQILQRKDSILQAQELYQDLLSDSLDPALRKLIQKQLAKISK